MTKMDPEVKQRWLEALRSGKYQQTDGTLKEHKVGNVFGYCCLGVLCEVAGVKQNLDARCVEFDFEDGDNTARTGGIPKNWKGIPQEEANRLVRMNDDDRASFDRIADYIEDHL